MGQAGLGSRRGPVRARRTRITRSSRATGESASAQRRYPRLDGPAAGGAFASLTGGGHGATSPVASTTRNIYGGLSLARGGRDDTRLSATPVGLGLGRRRTGWGTIAPAVRHDAPPPPPPTARARARARRGRRPRRHARPHLGGPDGVAPATRTRRRSRYAIILSLHQSDSSRILLLREDRSRSPACRHRPTPFLHSRRTHGRSFVRLGLDPRWRAASPTSPHIEFPNPRAAAACRELSRSSSARADRTWLRRFLPCAHEAPRKRRDLLLVLAACPNKRARFGVGLERRHEGIQPKAVFETAIEPTRKRSIASATTFAWYVAAGA